MQDRIHLNSRNFFLKKRNNACGEAEIQNRAHCERVLTAMATVPAQQYKLASNKQKRRKSKYHTSLTFIFCLADVSMNVQLLNSLLSIAYISISIFRFRDNIHIISLRSAVSPARGSSLLRGEVHTK